MIATSSSKHLVLIGTGRPHLQVMRGLARGTTNLRVTLAAPHPWYVDAAMLPGYVGGQWSREQVCRSVEHLIRMSGATFLPSRPLALDAANRRIQLSSGDALHYDVLSINEEGALERETLERIVPGARANALSVHPCSAFVQLWPQVLALSRTRALRVAIVGNGALAFELALAASQAMGHPYRSRITIIAGEEGILPGEPQALRRRAIARLDARNITVLHEVCVRLDTGIAHLASGAQLACDAPLLALPAMQPGWLSAAGLQADEETGIVTVNERLQSESHRQIFIVPDSAPIEAGAALEANLRSALDGGGSFKRVPMRVDWVRTLDCGSGDAIATLGPMLMEGSGAWRFKQRRDLKRCDSLFTL